LIKRDRLNFKLEIATLTLLTPKVTLGGCHFASENLHFSEWISTTFKLKPEGAIYFVQDLRTYSPRLG
jgi:hypothetical protein